MKSFSTSLRAGVIAGFLAAVLGSAAVLAQAYGPIVVQTSPPGSPIIALEGAPTVGVYNQGIVSGFSRHVGAGSVATANLPVLSACGTSSALATGSTDHAGKITVGTSASNACTLTFGTTYTTAPFCVYQNMTTGAAANVATVSATAIAWSSVLADSTVLMYICVAVGS